MRSKKNQLPEPVIDKKTLYQYVKSIFYLSADTDEQGTVESISRSMEFKGVGIWTLIFAVFIASLGLNTNSTAVIIGAMLISPLMGPIMGAGLSLGLRIRTPEVCNVIFLLELITGKNYILVETWLLGA